MGRGQAPHSSVTPDADGECRLRANCVVSIVCDGETVGSRIEDGVVIFNTKAGCRYTVKA